MPLTFTSSPTPQALEHSGKGLATLAQNSLHTGCGGKEVKGKGQEHPEA